MDKNQQTPEQIVNEIIISNSLCFSFLKEYIESMSRKMIKQALHKKQDKIDALEKERNAFHTQAGKRKRENFELQYQLNQAIEMLKEYVCKDETIFIKEKAIKILNNFKRIKNENK